MIGVYAFMPDMRGKYGIDVDYIGVSKNLEERIKSHFRTRKPYASTARGHIIYQEFKDKDKAECCESSLIHEFRPVYNRSIGREHRILYPHFYKVKNIKNVLNGIERKPW